TFFRKSQNCFCIRLTVTFIPKSIAASIDQLDPIVNITDSDSLKYLTCLALFVRLKDGFQLFRRYAASIIPDCEFKEIPFSFCRNTYNQEVLMFYIMKYAVFYQWLKD